MVFLAFANEQEGKKYLRNIPEEARLLGDVLREAKNLGLCELEERSNVTLAQVIKVFGDNVGQVAIFHFGGHADPNCLLLESSNGTSRPVHANALAEFLSLQKCVQLVFLNGCSTDAQARALLDAKIDAVVATARPIVDEVARDFAVAFYTELVNGRTFSDAFSLAGTQLKMKQGDSKREFLKADAPLSSEDIIDAGLPWKLYLRDGAENVAQESLPKLANRPLLGLPPLPSGTPLPPHPYRHLQRFTETEADVFFGRGREIADLYAMVTSPTGRRIILYSGATGVGKSSVLDAGLLPRLKAGHAVIYLRRDASAGLLGTLKAGLKPSGTETAPSASLARLWCARETSERPLVVVLDQAEEAFTRPQPNKTPAGEELAELVRGLQDVFQGSSPAPLGRLILAFRKEWLQEFQRAHEDVRLGFDSPPLGPLSHEGIVEAIEGPTLSDALQRRYKLTIAPGLADAIAFELERDAGSAVAPTLQVLLSKMWTAAGGNEQSNEPSFQPELYEKLKDEGFLLNDVVEEGLKTLRAWRADVVDSGFALDLLHYHTTPFGTADTCTRSELLERYKHRADVLDECLRLCESSYLLIPAAPEPGQHGPLPTRLGHDTLAPLILERFGSSLAPGQRARRLLENRAEEWKKGATGNPLDRPDLKVVESGESGMRLPTDDELRLIKASRQARDDQEEVEARNRRLRQYVGIGFAVGFVLLAITTYTAWDAARRANRKTAEVLTQSGISAWEQGHTFEAMHQFAQAVEKVSNDPKAQADDRLRLSFLGPGHGPSLRSILGHSESVNSASFSPDGTRIVTASGDNTARVWNAADGREIHQLTGHTGGVNSASFSPDGTRIVTTSWDNTARVWPFVPLTGEAETLTSWVEAFTGTEVVGGEVRPLSNAEWKARCRKLKAYGAKAPPSPWLDGLDLSEPTARP